MPPRGPRKLQDAPRGPRRSQEAPQASRNPKRPKKPQEVAKAPRGPKKLLGPTGAGSLVRALRDSDHSYPLPRLLGTGTNHSDGNSAQIPSKPRPLGTNTRQTHDYWTEAPARTTTTELKHTNQNDGRWTQAPANTTITGQQTPSKGRLDTSARPGDDCWTQAPTTATAAGHKHPPNRDPWTHTPDKNMTTEHRHPPEARLLGARANHSDGHWAQAPAKPRPLDTGPR